MVTGRHRSVNLDRILLLSLGQDADHDSGELRVGGQEVEAADRAGGDFDGPSWGQEARSSRHWGISREWWRHGRRDDGSATRRGFAVTDRRQPVFGRRAAPELPCGQSPTSPYIGRESGSRSAGESDRQRGWPIAVAPGGRRLLARGRDRRGWLPNSSLHLAAGGAGLEDRQPHANLQFQEPARRLARRASPAPPDRARPRGPRHSPRRGRDEAPVVLTDSNRLLTEQASAGTLTSYESIEMAMMTAVSRSVNRMRSGARNQSGS